MNFNEPLEPKLMTKRFLFKLPQFFQHFSFIFFLEFIQMVLFLKVYFVYACSSSSLIKDNVHRIYSIIDLKINQFCIGMFIQQIQSLACFFGEWIFFVFNRTHWLIDWLLSIFGQGNWLKVFWTFNVGLVLFCNFEYQLRLFCTVKANICKWNSHMTCRLFMAFILCEQKLFILPADQC